jgi:hypothetical protein
VLLVALLALALSSVVALADSGLRRGGSRLAEGASLVGP